MEHVILTLCFAFFSALHRSSTFQQLVSTQPPNHDEQPSVNQSGVVIIPTVHGGTPGVKKEGARVHLSELEVKGFAKYVNFFTILKIPDRFGDFFKHGPSLGSLAGIQR